VPLESGVDDQFLSDRVPRQFPGELVAEALLVFMVGRVGDFVVVVLEFAVVIDDGLGDGRLLPGRDRAGDRKESIPEGCPGRGRNERAKG